MSLTTDIAAVVAASNELNQTFQGKEAAINTRLNAALLAAPAARITLYINAITGNDENDGLSVANAVQTFTRALAIGANRSVVNIALLSDVTLTLARHHIRPDQSLNIYSHGYVYGDINASTIYKLNLTAQPKTDPELTGDWELTGFYAAAYGVNTINFQSVEIVFPPAPAAGTMVPDYYNGLLSANLGAGPPLMGLGFNDCKLTRSPGSVGVVSGVRTHFLSLTVRNAIYVTADLAGYWLPGIAAGTLPSSTPMLATNLSSL